MEMKLIFIKYGYIIECVPKVHISKKSFFCIKNVISKTSFQSNLV